VSYVAQASQFPEGWTVRKVPGAMQRLGARDRPGEFDREPLGGPNLRTGRAGVIAFGGWRKRLECGSAVQTPDVLMLDEPTNHLDLAASSG